MSKPNIMKNAKITSFFTPKGKDKVANSTDPLVKKDKENDDTVANSKRGELEEKVDETPQKRLKLEIANKESDAKPVMMSPENRQRMLANKLKAKITRMSRELPLISTAIGPTWFEALEPEFSKPYFRKLNDFVGTERNRYTVYPSPDEVWSWTMQTPIKEIRVVVLGQDPYHGVGQAHGLCFSVKKGIAPPPSLVNMYKELAKDIPDWTTPDHGYLGGWAEQGILLLNACLTVRKSEANSHKNQGWEQFTDAVIKYISDNCSGVVFLLWGSYAQKKAACVNGKKHHLLKSVHPSPLSAHRGFFGCKHFSQCNELLKANGKEPIDWAHLPPMP